MTAAGASRGDPITLYVASPYRLIDHETAIRYLAQQPIAHTTEDGAIQEALSAAPSEETPEERLQFLAGALGSIPDISPSAGELPSHTSYITQLTFYALRIATVEETALVAQHYGDRKNAPDALWLAPETNEPADQQLRLLASRQRLLHRFEIVGSTSIPAHNRPTH